MLTAIQDFVRDSFRPGEGGTLSTFTVGEHTVHVEAGPRALIAGVIRGQCPEAVPQRLAANARADPSRVRERRSSNSRATPRRSRRQRRCSRRISRRCCRPIMPPSAARMPGCGGRFRSRRSSLLVAGFATASWLRWRRAVATRCKRSRASSSIDASRSWRRWNFRGLKDPLARDPRAVLTAGGFAPRTIAGEWKPYLSLDSAMVVARARRTLGAPASATTALAGDTLRVGGTVSVDLLRRLRDAPQISGVAHVDLSAVRVTLPAALETLRRASSRTACCSSRFVERERRRRREPARTVGDDAAAVRQRVGGGRVADASTWSGAPTRPVRTRPISRSPSSASTRSRVG